MDYVPTFKLSLGELRISPGRSIIARSVSRKDLSCYRAVDLLFLHKTLLLLLALCSQTCQGEQWQGSFCLLCLQPMVYFMEETGILEGKTHEERARKPQSDFNKQYEHQPEQCLHSWFNSLLPYFYPVNSELDVQLYSLHNRQ